VERRDFAPLTPLPYVIALDGPAGSGKDTAAKSIAELLGYNSLDSGALYRVVALQALDTSTSVDDVFSLVDFATNYRPRFDSSGRVFLGHREVTSSLRHSEVERLTPLIAKIPEVRRALLASQLAYRVEPGLVTTGRDQYDIFSKTSDEHRTRTFGFYIIAEPEVRGARIAQRRLALHHSNVDVARIIEDIRIRDKEDRTRPVSPLVQHPDAVLVDTTNMKPEQVVGFIMDEFQKMKKRRRLE
jgi:cytidylate kinase